MTTTKFDVGSSSPFHAAASQPAKHDRVKPPSQLPISESDFRTIDHLLVTSGQEWYARHVNVLARNRNVVIITEVQPTGLYTANLLIAPFGNGYLVFFHGATRYDPDEDYVVSNCQSMSELCDVVSGHCGLPRTESFTYAGVPHISDTDADDLWGANPDEW